MQPLKLTIHVKRFVTAAAVVKAVYCINLDVLYYMKTNKICQAKIEKKKFLMNKIKWVSVKKKLTESTFYVHEAMLSW